MGNIYKYQKLKNRSSGRWTCLIAYGRFGETQKDSRVCEIASQKVGLSPYVLCLFAFQVTTNSITFKYHVFL